MEGTAEDDLIPTAKLAQNIAKLRPEEAKKRFLLLVATGAICPVHRFVLLSRTLSYVTPTSEDTYKS